MEDRRFDDLARALATGRSRRTVLGNVAGALVGLIGAGFMKRSAGAASCTIDGEFAGCEPCVDTVCVTTCSTGQLCCEVGATFTCAACCSKVDCPTGQVCFAFGQCGAPICTKDDDCAACNRCDGETGTCVSTCEGGLHCCGLTGLCSSCCDDSDCGDPDEFNCLNGVCIQESCGADFDTCAGAHTCCWGYYCISDGLYCVQSACQIDDDCNAIYFDTLPPCINGVCVGRLSGIGEPCETDAHCNGGWCSAGICTVQFAEGDPCTANDQCDTGRCVDGTCFHQCTRKGHKCHIDVDCCDGLICAGQMCTVPNDDPTVVVETPESGGSGNATPVDGTGNEPDPTPIPETGEAPVALPNTGSGTPPPTDHTLVMGAGVTAAAIALALANRMRPRAEESED